MSPPDIEVQWDPAASATPWSVPQSMDPGASIAGASLDHLRTSTRSALGLDPDRPVVVVGHQPELWHPGVLAKFIAGAALARRHDAQLVHLVLDAHRGPFGSIEWPVGVDPESLHLSNWNCVPFDPGTPMCHQPACPPTAAPDSNGREEILAGLQQCHDALAAAQGAGNAAAQFASTLDRLMDPWVGPRITVTASSLLETDIGRSMLAEMKRDAGRCAGTCNRAIDAAPPLGIHRLGEHDHGMELPLWIDRAGKLETAVDADLAGVEPVLHPKALLLTAMARLGLADVFVHGLGGWRYEPVMESWVDAWLGLVPSPRAMVTATMHLPLLDPQWIAATQAELVQQARRRRHDPETTSQQAGPGPTKSRSLAEIGALPRGSRQRREAYQRMHGWIHQQETNDDHDDQQCLQRLAELSALQSRRTWAFPMHAATELEGLRDGVEAAVR